MLGLKHFWPNKILCQKKNLRYEKYLTYLWCKLVFGFQNTLQTQSRYLPATFWTISSWVMKTLNSSWKHYPDIINLFTFREMGLYLMLLFSENQKKVNHWAWSILMLKQSNIWIFYTPYFVTYPRSFFVKIY